MPMLASWEIVDVDTYLQFEEFRYQENVQKGNNQPESPAKRGTKKVIGIEGVAVNYSFRMHGKWEKTEAWLKKGLTDEYVMNFLKEMGEMGVSALEKGTPKRTGLTSRSWKYGISKTSKTIVLYWTNTNKTKDGDMIAVLLQYGHGTGRGGYVKGVDYINPALKPVFDEISEKIEKVVMGE